MTERDGRRLEYEYDDLYRLIGERPGSSTADRVISYTYDSAGNRLTRDDTSDCVTTSGSVLVAAAIAIVESQ